MAVSVRQAGCSWCGGSGVARLRGATTACRCHPYEPESSAWLSADRTDGDQRAAVPPPASGSEADSR